LGKTDEERRAASAKAKLDSTAFMCKICRQTFMCNAKPSLLYLHVTSKHPDMVNGDLTACFDALAGFDPADPDGKKATAASASAAKSGSAKPKKGKKKGGDDGDLLSLLDAGLTIGGKKGKKKK